MENEDSMNDHYVSWGYLWIVKEWEICGYLLTRQNPLYKGESFEKKKSTLLIWENGTMQLLEFGKLNSLLNLYGTDSTILSKLVLAV